MKVYGISDLHLSFSTNKAMDVFGPGWAEHWKKIESNWRQRISEQDLVLIPGDLSWGMREPEAEKDLRWLEALPGIKVVTKGNHDYWWQSVSKIRKAYPGIRFLQNDSVLVNDVGICGTRGWTIPSGEQVSEQDQKMYLREQQRLQMAIASLPAEARLRVVLLHYPPLYYPSHNTEFTALLEANNIDLCVFGHLHKPGLNESYSLQRRGVRYELVSCDFLEFDPMLLLELDDN